MYKFIKENWVDYLSYFAIIVSFTFVASITLSMDSRVL